LVAGLRIDGYILCEVHVDRGRDDSVVPCVGPVAHIEWSSSSNVIDHALEESDLPPLPRSAMGFYCLISTISTQPFLAVCMYGISFAKRDSRLPWLLCLSR